MQLSAVLLARCIAFVESADLAPTGRVFFPDLTKAITERYQFQKYPRELADFDESKGVEFLEGKRGDHVIAKMTLYNTGILIDTRENTATSKKLINEALEWASSEWGVFYKPDMIRRYGYVSHLAFYSDMNLDALNPALARLASRITEALGDLHGDPNPEHYQTASLHLHHDVLHRKYAFSQFSIAPRAEAPLSDHKYFSESPLPTDLHLELLEEFEAGLIGPAADPGRSRNLPWTSVPKRKFRFGPESKEKSE